jgi:MATE family multidrug resistance protein
MSVASHAALDAAGFRPARHRQNPSDRVLTGGRPDLSEARKALSIAWPLTMSALVNMGISVTDVVMIAWLGSAALAASAVASDFYSIIVYIAGGTLAAISPMIAEARGARRPGDVRRATRQGFWVATVIAFPGAAVIWHADIVLSGIGVHPDIVETGMPYARMMALTFIPMTYMQVWRHFLAAHGRTRVMLAVMALALPTNAVMNYALMFGAWGFPAMGLAGAGASSLGVTALILAGLTGYVLRDTKLRRYYIFLRIWRPDWKRFADILRVGVPIGLTSLGETGVFLFTTVLMGVFGPEVVAAHAITLRMAGILYAPAVGLGQAVTVRVAYRIGEGNRAGATNAVLTGTMLALASAAGLFGFLMAARGWIPGWFVDPSAASAGTVTAMALSMLFCLALLQISENSAVIGTAILRGFKDTGRPMVLQLTGRWAIGFASGAALAFPAGLGGIGLWMGLVIGSAATAGMMWTRIWSFRFAAAPAE